MSKPDAQAPKFQFVGSTDSETTEKISWPVEAQAIIIRNKIVGKLSATAAFEAGVQEYNGLVESGEIEGELLPTELPESYTNKNAGSVLYGMKDRFLKRVNNPSARNHQETLAAAQQFGLVQEVAETDAPADESDADDGESFDSES